MIEATCAVTVAPAEGGDAEEAMQGPQIVSVISVVGDVEWSVFLGLPCQTAEQIAERFAGFPIPFDSADMGDAMGELCNILVGQVKALLDQRGLDVEISLPSVMRAERPEMLVQKDHSVIRTSFRSDVGGLWTGVIAGMPAA
jgi:chemotaxis protein CheX